MPDKATQLYLALLSPLPLLDYPGREAEESAERSRQALLTLSGLQLSLQIADPVQLQVQRDPSELRVAPAVLTVLYTVLSCDTVRGQEPSAAPCTNPAQAVEVKLLWKKME